MHLWTAEAGRGRVDSSGRCLKRPAGVNRLGSLCAERAAQAVGIVSFVGDQPPRGRHGGQADHYVAAIGAVARVAGLDSDHDPQGLAERIQPPNLTDAGYSFNI